MHQRTEEPSTERPPSTAPETAAPVTSLRSPVSLEASGVTQVFRSRGKQSVTALHDVSVSVGAGEFVAVVGPSGCGKSTLLRAFAGLDRPTHGQMLVDGDPVDAPRSDISLMFQAPTLLPWKTVLGNCLLPLEISGRIGAKEKQHALDLLAWAGLEDFVDRRPHELSGGMQQRVAICRALVSDPSVLLLDEPFGALDAMTREQMNLDLQQLWCDGGMTTVLITHDIDEAVFLAQRVIVLSGRPGSVLDVVTVDLPDRRDVSALESPAFSAACARIRSYFVTRN